MKGREGCFHTITLVGGRRIPCHSQVLWHGLHPPIGPHRYRVFSCDDHAGLLTDRLPASARVICIGDAVRATCFDRLM